MELGVKRGHGAHTPDTVDITTWRICARKGKGDWVQKEARNGFGSL